MNRGGREDAWALSGVVKARDVRNSLISVLVFSHEDRLNSL